MVRLFFVNIGLAIAITLGLMHLNAWFWGGELPSLIAMAKVAGLVLVVSVVVGFLTLWLATGFQSPWTKRPESRWW